MVREFISFLVIEPCLVSVNILKIYKGFIGPILIMIFYFVAGLWCENQGLLFEHFKFET